MRKREEETLMMKNYMSSRSSSSKSQVLLPILKNSYQASSLVPKCGPLCKLGHYCFYTPKKSPPDCQKWARLANRPKQHCDVATSVRGVMETLGYRTSLGSTSLCANVTLEQDLHSSIFKPPKFHNLTYNAK